MKLNLNKLVGSSDAERTMPDWLFILGLVERHCCLIRWSMLCVSHLQRQNLRD